MALTSFRTHGYATSTLRDIADACRIHRATLYYHFPAKRDLLEALAAPAMDAVDRLLAATPEHCSQEQQAGLLARQVDVMLAHAPVVGWLLNDPGVRADAAVWHRVLGHEQDLALRLGGGPDAAPLDQVRAGAALAALAAVVARFDTLLSGGGPDTRALVRRVALAAATAALREEVPLQS